MQSSMLLGVGWRVGVKYVRKTGIGAAYNMSAFDTLFAAQVNMCVLETVEWLRNCMFVSISVVVPVVAFHIFY